MYKVEVTNNAGYNFEVLSNNYKFNIDIKGDMITPPDTLLASLASCMGVYIRKYADGAKLDLNGFKVTAEAEFSKEPPACFRVIKVTFDFNGKILDERRQKALLEFIKNCPVGNTLSTNPVIEVKIKA